MDLTPDGPHSPERTAELGATFDACSRAITYATMAGSGGLRYPSDVYRLVAELYSATGRLPQVCDQIRAFLTGQDAGWLYESRGRDISGQMGLAARHLADAIDAARRLTTALRHVQADIAGLGVKAGNADA